MRTIDKIILHCAATREGQHFTVDNIRSWHLQRGFKDIGYHFVVYLDGSVHKGRDLNTVGAHTTGQNATSIGICYIGGCDKNLKPKDTRTPEQTKALVELCENLQLAFPDAKIYGHYEFAHKACPSFNVTDFCNEYGLRKG